MSKEQNHVKDAIKAYLDERAKNDEQFAQSYAKANKNIDECFDYVIGEAHKRGNAVYMTDAEVFGLAVHYYDEDDIMINKLPKGTYVNTSASAVELSEEDKMVVNRARRVQRFLSQPFAVAEQFTGVPGTMVSIEDTIKGFKMILDGEVDYLPEPAFLNVGTIEEAIEKGKKLLEQAGGKTIKN